MFYEKLSLLFQPYVGKLPYMMQQYVLLGINDTYLYFAEWSMEVSRQQVN